MSMPARDSVNVNIREARRLRMESAEGRFILGGEAVRFGAEEAAARNCRLRSIALADGRRYPLILGGQRNRPSRGIAFSRERDAS